MNIKVYLLVVLALFPVKAKAADILNIFDQFIVSNVVAAECGDFELEIVDRNLVNLEIVQTRALQTLQQQQPDRPVEDLFALMDARVSSLSAALKQRIDADGCATEDMQSILRLFEVQANMDLLGTQE